LTLTSSTPLVAAVTMVDATVAFVTLVARLEFPSYSPRIALVEIPYSLDTEL
jgi:hypothetical protein